MKLRVIYVAGPIRADGIWAREQNIRKAEEIALRIWEMGHAAICPQSQSRFYDEEEIPWEQWIEGDLEILRRCDGVFMVPGWRDSKGAMAEFQEALNWDIPRFESLAELEGTYGRPGFRKASGEQE